MTTPRKNKPYTRTFSFRAKRDKMLIGIIEEWAKMGDVSAEVRELMYDGLKYRALGHNGKEQAVPQRPITPQYEAKVETASSVDESESVMVPKQKTSKKPTLQKVSKSEEELIKKFDNSRF